jgi:hypothetical protein
VYFLTKEEYYTRFYKYLMKSIVFETTELKQPFFETRLHSLKRFATKENLKWLHNKERYLSKDLYNEESLKEARHYVDKV